MRRSGWILALAGLAGMVFFLLTDPRWGLARVWGPAVNPADAVYEASLGTLVGLAGSGIVLAIGLWLVTRRAA